MDRIKKNFGFGYMRLPMIGEEVDIPQTTAMVDAFLENGFNYFDTAHGYIDGRSERAIKECLSSRYPRQVSSTPGRISVRCFSSSWMPAVLNISISTSCTPRAPEILSITGSAKPTKRHLN